MKCEAGCKRFTGDETRHHIDCVFYPESFTKMYDQLEAKVKWQAEMLENAKETLTEVAARIIKRDPQDLAAVAVMVSTIEKGPPNE